MFESLKRWFGSITNESSLFEHADDELLHSALASLLCHFIVLDGRHGGREKHEFERIMKQGLGLSGKQIDHLYEAAMAATGDLREDLLTIEAHLARGPYSRMQFMQKLLQLIDIHGVRSEELRLFDETLHEIFPEVKEAGESGAS